MSQSIPYECSCPSNALPMELWCATCRHFYGEAREEMPLCWKCGGTGVYRVSVWNDDDAIRETVSRTCDCKKAKEKAK